MDFSALDNFGQAAPLAPNKLPLDDHDVAPKATGLLDGTFDAADLPHPLKSVSTDDFEHILSDKIDTAAATSTTGQPLSIVKQRDDGFGEGLQQSAAAVTSDPFGLHGGNNGTKGASTLDFLNAERQPVQHSNTSAPLPSLPVNVVLDDNDDDDDDDVNEVDQDDDANEAEEIPLSKPIAPVTLKASIYDDLESGEVPATATTAVASAAEKFISSEDLLGGFDSADDEVSEAAPHATSGFHAVQPDPKDLLSEHESFLSTLPVVAPQVAPVPKLSEVAPLPPVRAASAAKPLAPEVTSKPAAAAVADKKPRIMADEIFCKIGLGEWSFACLRICAICHAVGSSSNVFSFRL